MAPKAASMTVKQLQAALKKKKVDYDKKAKKAELVALLEASEASGAGGAGTVRGRGFVYEWTGVVEEACVTSNARCKSQRGESR